MVCVTSIIWFFLLSVISQFSVNTVTCVSWITTYTWFLLLNLKYIKLQPCGEMHLLAKPKPDSNPKQN